MNYNYGNADNEKAAAEYLVAFIKHLYSKGKNSFEISKILEIDYDLIVKLLKNDKLLESLKTRDLEFINNLKQQYPEPSMLQSKCWENGIYYHESSYGNTPNIYISGTGSYLKNIGPWQRQNYFTDPLSYYFGRKK